VVQGGVAIAALGILGWANVQAPWQMFVVALVSGAGWAAMSGATINALVAPWFDKERPKALSLAFNGASCGGLLFTPLWVALIAHYGFPTAAVLIGAGMIAIMAPVSIMILRATPDGQGAYHAPSNGRSRAHLLRDRKFITISLAFALGLFAQVGLVAHLVARLAPQFGAQGAAFTMSLITICAVAGRTLLGWIIGERDRRLAAAGNFAVQAAGTTLFAFGNSDVVLLAGCVLFGLGLGNLVSLPPLLLQKEFSAADVGKAVALIVAINQAVFAFAPATLGILRDFAGNYVLAFALVAALQAISAAIVLAGAARQ
jgi:predicted MFS family arabinose efflux permease